MKSITEIQQFQEGGKLIRAYPSQCTELFTYNPKAVTPYDIDKLFLPMLSPKSSDKILPMLSPK